MRREGVNSAPTAPASQPKGVVNAYTIKLLQRAGFDVSQVRSKSWNEFAKPGAPQFDFVITLCDDDANEPCPIFPGKPVTARWSVADPAAVKGTDVEIARAFAQAHNILQRRIDLLVALKISSLDQMSLRARLREIARREDARTRASAA